jgi:hypothetical protein
MRVCDRCGARITEDEKAKVEQSFHEKLESLVYRYFIWLTLGDKDLCRKCAVEFFKEFYPKIEALDKEIKEWVKKGESGNELMRQTGRTNIGQTSRNPRILQNPR